MGICGVLLDSVAVVSSVAAYSHQIFPLTICRLIGASVRPVQCGKTADRRSDPDAVLGRTGPGMRHVVGFGDRSMGRATFGCNFWVRHCNQWGLYTSYSVRVDFRSDAALFPNYFGQTCYIVLVDGATFLDVLVMVTILRCAAECHRALYPLSRPHSTIAEC